MGLPPAGAPPPSVAWGDRAPATSFEDPSILAFKSDPRNSPLLVPQILTTQPRALGAPD